MKISDLLIDDISFVFADIFAFTVRGSIFLSILYCETGVVYGYFLIYSNEGLKRGI